MSDPTPMTRARIFYARVDEFWRKEEKYAYLDDLQDGGQIEWQELKPDAKHNWLTEGMRNDFEDFLPIASKGTKADSTTTSRVIYSLYGRGVSTSRDAWAYNFSTDTLRSNMVRTIDSYNGEVSRWRRKQNSNIDEFLNYDDQKVWWSESLKLSLQQVRHHSYSAVD